MTVYSLFLHQEQRIASLFSSFSTLKYLLFSRSGNLGTMKKFFFFPRERGWGGEAWYRGFCWLSWHRHSKITPTKNNNNKTLAPLNIKVFLVWLITIYKSTLFPAKILLHRILMFSGNVVSCLCQASTTEGRPFCFLVFVTLALVMSLNKPFKVHHFTSRQPAPGLSIKRKWSTSNLPYQNKSQQFINISLINATETGISSGRVGLPGLCATLPTY